MLTYEGDIELLLAGMDAMLIQSGNRLAANSYKNSSQSKFC